MNYTALDIVHFWADSREKLIQSVLPSNGRIYVCCTVDLNREAAKVCSFISLVVKRPWTFQTKIENEQFVIEFFPETVTLENLF